MWRRLQPVGVISSTLNFAATKTHRLKPAPLEAHSALLRYPVR